MQQSKRNKYLRLFLLIPIVIFIIGIVIFASKLDKQKKQIKGIDKSPVDISKIKDGKYHGKAEGELVKVELDVWIRDGEIKEVKLLHHENGLGKKAENIIDSMINHNSVEVDSISGATISSEYIKAAVRNALR